MWLIRFFLFIIAVVVLVGFIHYNSAERVSLYFPWANYHNVPLTLVILITFVAGMLVAFIYSVFYFLKVAADIRDKNREVKQLEVELSALRNRSLEDLDETAPEKDPEE
jgi:uncharacterized integral membrane protein